MNRVQRGFRGVSALNLDDKGRLAMPAKYRDALITSCEGQLVVTIDTDGCLLIYPVHEWDAIEAELINLPSVDPQARRLKRLLMGHATDCVMDSKGRFVIPPKLRAYAGLKDTIVLIGQGNKFEMWDEETWNRNCDTWIEEENSNKEVSQGVDGLRY